MKDKLAIYGGKPIRDKYLSYGHQWIDENDILEVTRILKSDYITQGQKVMEFEEVFANYCNAKYAVSFSSGTAALHGAAYAAGIKKNDEAITSPITFVASSNCVLYLNGKAKFADIKKQTFNINFKEIKEKINNNTRVLIPVDFSGQPCDLDEIKEIAEDNDLTVLEDASHALGAEYKGKKIGSISDLTTFSFHPVKHITTGEGGMVLTNNKDLYEKLSMFRTHGITKNIKKMKKNEGGWYYEMQELGFNYRITDFQCALGISQLKRLNSFIKRRREIVKIYNDSFKDIDEIIIPFEKSDVKSTYHLYVVQINLEMLKADRKQIFDALRAENIGVHVHYIPVHLQPYYMKNFGFKRGDFPISEYYYDRCLTLPLYPDMSKDDIDDVTRGVIKVLNHYRI